jgi:hypothetical protein
MQKGLLLLIIALFCQCQNKFRSLKDSPLVVDKWVYDSECGWFGTMSEEERRKTFPFNEAAKVLLIAYGDYEIEAEREDKTPEKRLKLPILRTFKAFDSVYSAYELKELNQQQLDSLSHFAFNYKPKSEEGVFVKPQIKCYTPRNSILFFDKNDKLFLNIEMCFDCDKIYFTPAQIPSKAFNVRCRDLSFFKAFFKQCNVHYGVDSLKN